jgi:Protein of unknown function (DUF1569)
MSDQFSSETIEHFNERIDKLLPETQRHWGSMTVSQMLAHMNDAFRIALGMKPAKVDSNLYKRYIMFPVAVYLLPAWPKGEKTAPELNQQVNGTPPRDFYTEAEFLKKMMEVFNERESTKIKPHPMFGYLNKKQWRDLLRKHLNHHLKQFGV